MSVQRTSAAISFAVLALVVGLPLAAAGTVIDFSGFAHGEVIGSAGGHTVVTTNLNNAFNLGVVFDTTLRGTADPDLEGPNGIDGVTWNGGNLPTNTILGKVLIIQENNSGCAVVGDICSLPDDEGGQPAGDFDITFSAPITGFGFDLIDIEGMMENGSIVFHDGASTFTLDFSDFIGAGAFGQGAVYGNNTANRISVITAGDVGLTQFDSVTINLAGSGAVTNLNIVPEPAVALLLLLGASTLIARARA